MRKYTKIKIAMFCVGLVAGWFISRQFITKSWESSKDDFKKALVDRMMSSGAPSVEMAESAAVCIADALIPFADKIKCPMKEGDLLADMADCLNSNSDFAMTFMDTVPNCIEQFN